MRIIDAHHHFWNYNNQDFDWITEEMEVIRKSFLPGDFESVLAENNVDGCVTVQVNQTEKENKLFLDYARKYDFIKGVVGWIDLMSGDIDPRLAHWQKYPKLKGFRHILQGEPERALMLHPAFKNGISCLERYNFTYDILIFPDQLRYALELVKAFPGQKFVIDHLAKPYIKSAEIEDWKNDMQAFADLKNVYCKVSGMVTEADWNNHSLETFRPYLDVVTGVFGTRRLIFGSDWPVCLVAASYKQVLDVAKQYFSSFSPDEQDDIFYNNAIRFYNL